MSDRLSVAKTYKLFINGAFPRSESGRSFVVSSPTGEFVANVAHGSRKDVRDAVTAARGAFSKWSGASAYNRGQILYRFAEMLEARRSEFISLVAASEEISTKKATAMVYEGIDRVVWYAGWTDKIAQVLGGTNPVAGPYFNFSIPGPSGVIAVVAPTSSSFLGFLSTVMPPLAAGNTVVAIAGSPMSALVAVVIGEVSATSDLPAGVLNIITGYTAELGPVVATHEDVDGVDLAGAGDLIAALSADAASTIKRVVTSAVNEFEPPTLQRLRAFIEITTVWHTVGQ